jgi:membrane protein required for colicin V production
MGQTLIGLLPEGLEQQVTDMLQGGTGLTEDSESPAVPVDEGTDETEDGTVVPPATVPAAPAAPDTQT